MTALPDDLNVTDALSLTQPWATLVAIGAKRFETRSWRTGARGWIAIHASKGFPADCRDLCFYEPFKAALADAGYTHASDLPVGRVIAVARHVATKATNEWTPARDSDEFAFGNYGPNRYAWELQDAAPIVPFEARGQLGIWKLPRAVTLADVVRPAS